MPLLSGCQTSFSGAEQKLLASFERTRGAGNIDHLVDCLKYMKAWVRSLALQGTGVIVQTAQSALRQEEQELRVIFGYIMNLKPASSMGKPICCKHTIHACNTLL